MPNSQEITGRLVDEATPVKPLPSPRWFWVRLVLGYALYAGGALYWMGLRPDFVLQLMRPLYLIEILILFFIVITSLYQAVLCQYPDRYGRRGQYLPWVTLGLFVLCLGVQAIFPAPPNPVLSHHGFECLVCITVLAVLPGGVLFWLNKQGATVTPRLCGALSALAAFALGCLVLRLSEQNDSVTHLLYWHYTPLLMAVLLGYALGRKIFRW
jgi:hypothetical protein